MDRLSELIEALRDEEDIDRAMAATGAVAREADASWLPRLKEVVETGPLGFIREIVARTVFDLAGVDALPSLLIALRLGMEEGADNDSLAGTLGDLFECYPDEAFPIIVPMAASLDPVDRWTAAWSLGYLKTEQSTRLLITLLNDPSESTVKEAIGSLGGIGSSEAVAAIRALPWLKRWKYRGEIKTAFEGVGVG